MNNAELPTANASKAKQALNDKGLRPMVLGMKTKDTRPLGLFGVSVVYLALLLSYSVLPAVSTSTLKLFTCNDYRADGGPHVLVDDMSIECGTATHTAYQLIGVLMMLSPLGGASQR